MPWIACFKASNTWLIPGVPEDSDSDQRVVETGITEDDVVVWRCLACGTEGRISNWQGTFWDLSQGTPSN